MTPAPSCQGGGILRKVLLQCKKTIGSATSIEADIEADGQFGVNSLASAHQTSYGPIFNILHKDLSLVTNSARWVPKFPVHNAHKVHAFLAKKSTQIIPCPLFWPDLALADFFLVLMLKRKLQSSSRLSRSSRTCGRGSSVPSPKTNSPEPSRGVWSNVNNAFVSTVSRSRKVRKYIWSFLQLFSFYS